VKKALRPKRVPREGLDSSKRFFRTFFSLSEGGLLFIRPIIDALMRSFFHSFSISYAFGGGGGEEDGQDELAEDGRGAREAAEGEGVGGGGGGGGS